MCNILFSMARSRNVLTHQIESKLWEREGKAIANFQTTLPTPQSDLAQQTLKDPYVFDFLSLSQDYDERELERNLIEHITQFLLELGAGFVYMGRQVPLQVGDRDFFLDLLFYHTHLHCYVVIELKTGDFEPEHAGKLNFYLKATDELLRRAGDEPSIGLLLCKNRDRLVAEWALSGVHKPIGVAGLQIGSDESGETHDFSFHRSYADGYSGSHNRDNRAKWWTFGADYPTVSCETSKPFL